MSGKTSVAMAQLLVNDEGAFLMPLFNSPPF